MSNENLVKTRSMTSDLLNEDEANCALCTENDNIEMVACDGCQNWFHFKCVGVDADIAHKEWLCATCIAHFKNSTKNKMERERELSAKLDEVERLREQLRADVIQQKLEELKHLMAQTSSDQIKQHGRDAKAEAMLDDGADNAPKRTDSKYRTVINDQNQSTPRSSNVTALNKNSTICDGEHQAEHFLARQTIARDLPLFSGSPEQWPTFVSSYECSTKACKFSEVENLCRLQKALKGNARKMVECYLTHPSNVTLIIDTLKMLYGRPALIIQTKIDKIKKTPVPRSDKLETLVFYAVQVRNLIAAIESANVKEYLNDIRLLHELVERFPSQTRLDWGLYEIRELKKSEQKLKQFSTWLDTIAQGACNVMTRIPQMSKFQDNSRVNIHSAQSDDSDIEQVVETCGEKKCLICNKIYHSPAQCRKLEEMDLNNRWKAVNRLKLCRICMFQHKSPRCKKAKECGINGWKKLHHQLLHKDDLPRQTSFTNTVANATQRNCNGILYRIVPVTLKYGCVSFDTFAFIDDGSSITLIEDRVSKKLGVEGKRKQLCMRWTDGQSHVDLNSKIVKLEIVPRNDKTRFYEISAQTISCLDLPTQSVDRSTLVSKYKNLRHAQFDSFKNAKPTILIGLDNWHLCVPRNVREGSRYEPVATKIRLGWDLCGVLSPNVAHKDQHVNVHLCDCSDGRLEQMIKNFYSLDAVGISIKNEYMLTDDEKRAEKTMKDKTIQRGKNYEVGLLWKYDQFDLPNSYTMAYNRLLCLEKRLIRSPRFQKEFTNQMKQYVEKGFMRKLSPPELEASCKHIWYMPVLIVENPNKPGKIRLVFDAGISLNTMLLTGPDLTSPLLEILMRFRVHTFAVTGDIHEMFHMIHVRYEDQMAQRILWRDCKQTEKPDIYVMTVLTFGATCSPYQAQYIMRTNASKYAGKYGNTVTSITQNTYVDDVLDGHETEDEVIILVQEMKYIHSEGGFEIRNFKSNSSKLRMVLNQVEDPNASYDLSGNDGIEKVLGIFWSINEDCITFSLRFNKANKEIFKGARKPTKREILLTLMSIYDPLGLISHFVSGLKMIQQETWRYKLGWDESIPDDLDKRWKKWLSQLNTFESLKIPRRYISVPWIECRNLSIHTFVDAGESAYATAVYLRVVTANDIQVSLMTAKVKAALLKYTPIPRLELQAATIGARLSNTAQNALNITIHNKYFWSDSTVVLSWLHSRKKLPAWVACRVGEIRETTDINQWRWVPTNENVAGIPTKWRDTIELNAKTCWYRGPDFLMKGEQFSPKPKCVDENGANLFESEDPTFEYVALHSEITDIIDISRFSKWNRLLRTTAYFLRFINLIKKSTITEQRGILKDEGLRQADIFLFREAQKLYSADVALLKKKGRVPNQSQLYKLSPMLDQDKIIRLRGRIENEYPIILPNSHRITMLLVMNMHEECAHQFSETVVNRLRRQFHIPRLRALVKQIQRQCQKCKMRLARPAPPEMSPLPAGRLAVNQAPFSHTGIDLFGPLMVIVHRKPEKRWVVIFTCLTIRAIHLELVSEMTTDCFLMAFRNFVARRGQPLECYSDRGTNLIGAEKVIRAAYQEVNFETIEEVTTTPTLKWHFNPPLPPHMGGAWERLIRSVKLAMNVTLNPLRKPSPEVLQNILIEIEFLINSRPLTYVPLDDPGQEAITPNHALLAYKNPAKPLGIPIDNKAPKLLWRQSQQALQRFYHQWVLTYRPTLTRRSKWFESPAELQVGDLVVIFDENDKTRGFPKGRIIEVTRSRDGHVRAATVQTSGGIYVRPTVMLAKLDVDVGSDGHPAQSGV